MGRQPQVRQHEANRRELAATVSRQRIAERSAFVLNPTVNPPQLFCSTIERLFP